ncbi:hypothetical protein ACS5NO_17540 [Larkinella sp. GY13]|uniref:hypothetical protein n=1 Tax=Larkinella sp. GY13 TaxID=3453720 RepID=UPI003EEB3A12
MQIPVMVPVKSHIQKFIINRYGDGKNHSIPVRKMTFLGDILALALVKNTFMTTRFEVPSGPCLVFHIPSETKFMEVPEKKLRMLQVALDRHFRDCLISFVMGYHFATGDQMQAVKKFLDVHDIDEEMLSADTAWKVWRDFEVKMERKRKKSFRQVVGASGKPVGEIENLSVVFAMS